MGKRPRVFNAGWNGTGRWEVIWLMGWDGSTRSLDGAGRDGIGEPVESRSGNRSGI